MNLNQKEVKDTLIANAVPMHTHDGRYYTESETDALLDEKSDTTHNHDERYYTKPDGGIPKTDLASDVQTSLGKADTALQSADFSGKEDKSNKVTSMSSLSTDTQYPSAKAVYDAVDEVKEDLSDFTQLPYYGNYYNKRTTLLNYDINSATGAIVSDNRYKVSDKIVMDFTKRLYVRNSTYSYCYCYGENDTYYGRVDVNNTGDTIYSRYPDTAYVRIVAKMADTNIMLVYFSAQGIVYENYKPIGGTILKENDAKVIRVLQYNVGRFSGIEPEGQHTITTALGYRKLIAEIKPNIACYQGDTWTFSTDPKNYVFAINNYRVEENGGDYNQHYIASDYEIGLNGRQTYANPSAIQTHKIFTYATVKVNGKAILIVNIHFDWNDKNDRAREITRILDSTVNYDNVIICGDFNPADYINGVKQSNNLLWEAELARFESAGYTCANGTGYFGNINTFADQNEIPGAWDNILVKGSLKIKNANRYEADWLDDHYPFYADIVVG